jgi:hypothetical protein
VPRSEVDRTLAVEEEQLARDAQHGDDRRAELLIRQQDLDLQLVASAAKRDEAVARLRARARRPIARTASNISGGKALSREMLEVMSFSDRARYLGTSAAKQTAELLDLQSFAAYD